jgi:flagellar biosynthesis protein FlhB
MSEHAGEKTEAPTQRKLEEAQKQGQIAKSAEVQTVFVLVAGVGALTFTGGETWNLLAQTVSTALGHLHDTPVSATVLPAYAIGMTLIVGKCVWPVLVATLIGGLLAGGLQNRFSTHSEALAFRWEKLNPVPGFQRIFSFRSAAPTGFALIKLCFIGLMTWSTIKAIMSDPIFSTSVSVGRLAGFLADSSLKIFTRVILLLAVIAAADYAYQSWRHYRDMMMTKEEVKEEAKNTEGNQQVKAGRRRLMGRSKRKMLAAVPQADVVVTNPTHYAVALRYDRKSMRAPRIVAKGIRLNALQIRELALAHQVPVLENKPLARLLYKHGKVGGEIPAQLYAAVAEVLAWVYKTNRYRYYTEANRT